MSVEHTAPPLASEISAGMVTELLVNGMTCNNCALRVTDAIQGVPGVHSASVTLDTGRASVRWACDAEISVPALLAAVKGVGYEAQPPAAAAREGGAQHQAGWQTNLWVGVFGTVPLMLGEWVLGLGMMRWFQWLSFVLAGIVQVFAGAPFYRGAWRQLKVGHANMDTLVALGSTTAFGYSTWALFSGHGGHVYFMEAAAIITLISFGHWLEARVSARASSALKSLLSLAPPTARRRQPDGSEQVVNVTELKPGDEVVLKPGDRVPTDGAVVEGGASVDEAMLTGESAPVDKSAKSELYAGTVNLDGWLVMRVTATGESTALAHIIAAVQRAQASRANIQRLGDSVSNVFVPVVVFIAIAAGLWWGLAPNSASQTHDFLAKFLWPAHPPTGELTAAFIIATGVLIIACPCAMGLATPAAIMAGSNAAARRGILIRDGVALEKAGRVTSVLFDKTGTLTIGRPTVAKIWDAAPTVAAEVTGRTDSTASPPPYVGTCALAAALARHSTHPLSQAVAKLAPNEVAFDNWLEVRGSGVQGEVSGSEKAECTVRLGSMKWLEQMGVDASGAKVFVGEWSARGATVLGFAAGKKLAAAFAIEDALKPGAAEAVRRLRENGLKVYLVTGDGAATATNIAAQAGIAEGNVFAEARPEQKAEFVRKLQTGGERVAFIGDGINDAPALAQADLGIAVSRASDIAREAADIILLKSEIEAVPESLGLARATLRTIKQNLFWAFFYNALGVPLAALGFISPVFCALAMGLSDLIVIGNALRVLRWRGES